MAYMRLSASTALAIAFTMIAGTMIVSTNTASWGEIEEESIFETVEDFDDDGKINYLVINVPIENVSWYGSLFLRDYIRVNAELWNETGSDYITYLTVESDIGPDTGDSVMVQLKFLGRTINASEVDGPYMVKIGITHLVTSYYPPPPYTVVSEILGYFEYITSEYTHDDFETPNPYEIALDWEAVDDDDNGLYDWLRVNATVNATDGDIIDVTLELAAGYGPDQIVYGDRRILDPGQNQTIYVDVDGRLMNGLSREDTWYDIYISFDTIDGFHEWGWIKTDPLNATDFEEYPISVVDGPAWAMIDVNNDGLQDFLRASFNVAVEETQKYRLTTELSNGPSPVSLSQRFDGYLITGFEETVIAYFDASEMYESGMTGPFELEVHESPMMYDRWPNYTYIEPFLLANMSIEEVDFEQLNHPQYIYLSGYVKDEAGDPVAGSEVSAMSQNGDWDWLEFDAALTDGDGFYNLTRIIPGSIVSIVVESTGYFEENRFEFDLDSNTTDYSFTLVSDSPADASVRGTVYDDDGEPVVGAVVALVRPGAGFANVTTTNQSGEYRVDVREGEYVVFAMAVDLDFENDTYSLSASAKWLSLVQDDSANIDITLNISYELDLYEGYMSLKRNLQFGDWDGLELSSTLTMGEAYSDVMMIYALYADVLYGNADGYVSESESELMEKLTFDSYPLAMGYYTRIPRQCELYLLEDFCLDGIGYLVQPEDAVLTTTSITGPLWEDRDELVVRLDLTGVSSYWPIPEGSTHDLYLEVPYANQEYTGVSDEGFDITAPEGFVLTSTNEPENMTIEGLNHVTVVPGGSPDPYNVTSALVLLEFSSTTSEDTGSVHGTANLQEEAESSGILVELLDSNLTVLSSVTTVSTGEFIFSDLDPGEYWIRANFTGYLDAYEHVNVTAGMTTEIALELSAAGSPLEPGSFSGLVVTQAGLPVNGALVELFTPADGDAPIESTQADAYGSFELTGLDRGGYRIEISADGFHTRTFYHILDDGEEKDLGLIELMSDSPVGYIIGVVEDMDGNPVAEVVVQVRAEGSDTVLGENTTDPDGEFMIIGLEDGVYNLTLVLDGNVVGYGEVTVEDFVGDAGVIQIDLSEVGVTTDAPLWPWMVLAAVAIVAAVAAILKLRKPKSPEPSGPEEGEEPPPTDE
jgi:hypothetical protein